MGDLWSVLIVCLVGLFSLGFVVGTLVGVYKRRKE